MAVVLQSEESGLFSTGLRRSHSQAKFGTKTSSGFHTSASASRLDDPYGDVYPPYQYEPGSPTPSSAPSSPQTVHAESVDPSYSSTPATNLSLDGHCEEDGLDDEDRILLPSYDTTSFYPSPLEDPEPPVSPRTGDSCTVSPPDHGTSSDVSRPESPDLFEHAEDDTAVKHHPTQHVDYLSHNWKEEDIWSSWRYIVSKRHEYSNGPRLENASWRTWMKAKYRLKTVSPETLNWLKDCDVTWLYGPLQTRNIKFFPGDSDQGGSTPSRNDSFICKKPILKKRSMSEIMLQRSISSSSLLKQATAAIQAQQRDQCRPILARAATDFMAFPFGPPQSMSRRNTSNLPSTTSSGDLSPSTGRKHIHFDEQVKQCIAVDTPGDDDEEDVCHGHWYDDGDSDSDDGAIMMKPTATRKTPVRPRKATVSVSNESKTIAMLPSTTLKYREDTPQPQETAMKHTAGPLQSPLLSPCSSQETLRPSKQSTNSVGGNTEHQHANDETTTTPLSSPVDPRGLEQTSSTNSLTAEPAGMRRTESGMFMPYEDGEARGNDGIIGRVVDSVNTARDIAYVIWNAGWGR